MFLKGSLFLSALISVLSLNAQLVVQGRITAADNGEVLIGAGIADTLSGKGATANNYGLYSLSLNAGRKVLLFSFPGYEEMLLDTVLSSSITLNLQLKPIARMDELVIKSKPRNTEGNRIQMSMLDVPVQQIKKMPALLGEVDVVKALQLLPGVKGGNEGSSGLYVRGGGPDQNLILLDGVPLYNIQHMFGFFSVFNADAINNIQLYKGGFPARFGGRLSSVLDISMKEGNTKRHQGEGSISPIAAKLSMNGPLSKDGKTTYAVSYRRSLFDLLLRSAGAGQNTLIYNFYDLNMKLCHRLNDRNRFYASFYSGRDKLYTGFVNQTTNGSSVSKEKIENSLIWGNTLGALRWNRIINVRSFVNHTLSYTEYRYKNGLKYQGDFRTDTSRQSFNLDFRYGTGIRDLAWRSDVQYNASDAAVYRYGLELIQHRFKPGVFTLSYSGTGITPLDTVISPAGKYNSLEMAVYGETERNLGRGLNMNAGIRLANYLASSKYRFMPEPRISFRQLMTNNLALKLSYALMNQPIHLLTNSTGGLPWDLWFPATAKIRPQRAQQIALGISQPWKYGIEFSLESYYKWMNHIVDYAEGTDLFDVQVNWEDKVRAGKGWMYGTEMMVQKRTGRLNGWLAYTLSWSERKIPEINFGQKYFFKWDRRHHATAVAIYKLNKAWELSATFVLQSGNAITLPQGRYLAADGTLVNDYIGKNAQRMPLYHRLDFGINKLIKPDNRFSKTKQYWNLSVYNVYNRFNPFFVDIDNTAQPPKVVGVAFFRLLPVLTYSYKF
ncbi:MAG: TonB-dependent receptor plug domain-containing protein [Bacteroidetes bacterium]|nr:TonB-dependent receptor plug domain-containing protein [Bacteroidota bacterium]